MPDIHYLNGIKKITLKGISVNINDRMMTGMKGVFAGGDFVRGPSTAIEAIADGIKAAEEIHRFLSEKSEFPEVIDAKNLSYDASSIAGDPHETRKNKWGIFSCRGK